MNSNIVKLMSAVVKTPEGDQVYEHQQYATTESFEAFTTRLEAPEEFKLFVSKNCRRTFNSQCHRVYVRLSFQVNYCTKFIGNSDIGDTVRQILKRTMTNTLMQMYNRTGRNEKRKLPDVFVNSIKSAFFCSFGVLHMYNMSYNEYFTLRVRKEISHRTRDHGEERQVRNTNNY